MPLIAWKDSSGHGPRTFVLFIFYASNLNILKGAGEREYFKRCGPRPECSDFLRDASGSRRVTSNDDFTRDRGPQARDEGKRTRVLDRCEFAAADFPKNSFLAFSEKFGIIRG